LANPNSLVVQFVSVWITYIFPQISKTCSKSLVWGPQFYS
jgi:hypothetical protein